MKKILLSAVAVALLSGCSADPEKLQSANDSFQKSDSALPNFSPLASGGVNLPKADSTYELPQLALKKGASVDIRPPSTPLAIIQNSLTQFDGERALIVFSHQQAEVYNLQQVERLLKEEGIGSTNNGAILTTDWADTGRADDKANTQIKYQIEQVTARDASALTVSVFQMRRDGVMFTPSVAEKQRYTSDRLNRIVTALNSAYQKQQQDLSNASVGAVQSGLIQDLNGNTALAMNASFGQAWEKLGSALPKIGFDIKAETAGKGYRELKYASLDKQDWRRLGVDMPELEKGTYQMQISDHGRQSSVVISDEKGTALSGENATRIYQALGNIIAR